MAIDSTNKKLSLLNYMRPDMIVLPEGDGSFNVADKQHFLNIYSGISVAIAIAGPYCVVAAGIFTAGKEVGGTYIAGAEMAQGGCY